MRNIDRTNINRGTSLSPEDWALESIFRKVLREKHIFGNHDRKEEQECISENVKLYHAWKEYFGTEAGKYTFPITSGRWEAEKILSEYAEKILAMSEEEYEGKKGILAIIRLTGGIEKWAFVEDDGTVIFVPEEKIEKEEWSITN